MLALPDHIWLNVLRHLDSNQLSSLAELHHLEKKNQEATAAGEGVGATEDADLVSQLGRVACDYTLWRRIRWSGRSLADLNKIVKFLGPHTTSVELLGRYTSSSTAPGGLKISESFWRSLKLRCPHVKKLVVRYCDLDYNHRLFQARTEALQFWRMIDTYKH